MRRAPMVERRPVGRPAKPLPPLPSPLPPMLQSLPPAGANQALLRERRRRHQPVHYRGDLAIHTEILECCQQLAFGISQLPRPLSMRPAVDNVADAVHAVQSTAVGIVAESRSVGADARARSRQAVFDLAVRPQAPDITDEQIISGSWAAKLAAWTEVYAGDLAFVLGRALPPGHGLLKAELSVSERLERALRELDSAVLAAQRRLAKVADRQALPSIADFNRQQQERVDAERRDHALAKLGAV